MPPSTRKLSWAAGLTTELHQQVVAMNRDNFIVRMHLKTVERFQNRETWNKLNEDDRELLQREVRIVEMIIERLTASGVMAPGTLYEPSFINLYSGGPDGLFAGKDNVIEGIFQTLDEVHAGLRASDS